MLEYQIINSYPSINQTAKMNSWFHQIDEYWEQGKEWVREMIVNPVDSFNSTYQFIFNNTNQPNQNINRSFNEEKWAGNMLKNSYWIHSFMNLGNLKLIKHLIL